MVALAKPDNQILDMIIQGDCLEVLSTLADNSIDALCCDPPAGINFMNKPFDDDRGGRKQWVAWLTEIMIEVLRVMKPGSHGFVWALPRTSHWTATALEDAGFEIRDVCTHIQGQGFPKSLNLGNGQGTALKPASEHWILARKPLSEKSIAENVLRWGTGGLAIDQCRVGTHDYTQEQWTQKGLSRVTGNSYGVHKASDTPVPQGRFPSNLLLSHSLFCVPLGEKRVKANGPACTTGSNSTKNAYGMYADRSQITHRDPDGMETIQAWECTEDCPIRLLDKQSGVRKSGASDRNTGESHTNTYGWAKGGIWKSSVHYGDQGGASRYFSQFSPTPDDYAPFLYTSKASRRERNQGCEGLPSVTPPRIAGLGSHRVNRCPEHNATLPSASNHYECGCKVIFENNDAVTNKELPRGNHHPTVKPLALCRWLIRLICREGGVVLDPFCGSGSILISAIYEHCHYIGVEQDVSYVEIARKRVEYAQKEVGLHVALSSYGKADKDKSDCQDDLPLQQLQILGKGVCDELE